MIRLHRESSEQTDRKMGPFTKPREIKQTRARNAQEKALQLYPVVS